MKKILLMSVVACSAVVVTTSYAESPPVLNTIQYAVQVKQFVTTQTAEVTLDVNASAQQSKLADVQKDVMNKLSKLVTKVDWHVNYFQMSQDQSGLQTLQWQVSARVPQVKINTLQQKLKTYSQAGQQYKVKSINFAPSLSEYQQAKMQLRDQVYQEAKRELQTLKREFPKSHYFVHQINFNENTMMPMPMNQTISMARINSAAKQGVSLGRELIVSANISFANEVE